MRPASRRLLAGWPAKFGYRRIEGRIAIVTSIRQEREDGAAFHRGDRLTVAHPEPNQGNVMIGIEPRIIRAIRLQTVEIERLTLNSSPTSLCSSHLTRALRVAG